MGHSDLQEMNDSQMIQKGKSLSVQEKIKENLLKEIYTDIDKMYDYMEQHFNLSDDHEKLVIKQLNKLKDQFYLIVKESPLS